MEPPVKKVLHTLCRIESGGVEQRRLLLAKNLPREKYQHVLICQEAKGTISYQLRELGWKIHEIGLASHILNFKWHAKALAIAREFKPDIVHGAVYEGVALAVSIGLRMPNVKVITEETSDPVNRRWTGNLLMRAMLTQSDACIGVSPKVADYLVRKIHVSPSKVHVISNAVAEVNSSSAHDLNCLRKALGLNSEHRIVGSVGRLEDSVKRFSDIIRAMPKVLSEYPTARLLIVGDGLDRQILKDLAVSLHVSEAVVFAGYQSDPRPFYELMEVFVLASAHEAFGLVLVEAMLAGVPIIATRVGGIPFVLDEGQAGVLIPSLSPDILAFEIAGLLNDSEKRQSLREAGIKRARSAFSVDRYCREIDGLYQRLTIGRSEKI